MMPHGKGHESTVFISGCLVEILLAKPHAVLYSKNLVIGTCKKWYNQGGGPHTVDCAHA